MAEPGQHLEPLQLLTQVCQYRPPVAAVVGLDDALKNATAAVAQLGPQHVLVVAAELAHQLFDVHRQIERRPIDGQMVIAGHAPECLVR
jgi:hypothetical protein